MGNSQTVKFVQGTGDNVEKTMVIWLLIPLPHSYLSRLRRDSEKERGKKQTADIHQLKKWNRGNLSLGPVC